MAKDNIKFYENFDWKTLKFSDLEEKIKLILKMIPADDRITTYQSRKHQIRYTYIINALDSLFTDFA